jgi:hypothetical protein
MDTNFWGPDGWKLLHSIAIKYPLNPTLQDREIYASFFKTISSVLPCIYCRISFEEYITELPIDDYTESRKKLCTWLYLIHNKVNSKLRKQKLNNKKNPKYNTIMRRYDNYVRDINNGKKTTPGFDFLYSIVFNYIHTRDKMTINRVIKYRSFFNILQTVIPFNDLKQIYFYHINTHPINITKKCNHSLKLWLYNLELSYKNYIDKSCLCFKNTCINIEKNKVGCKNNTCRKSK